MKQIFLSVDGRLRSNWREAFPELLTAPLASLPHDAGLVWVLLLPTTLVSEAPWLVA